MAKKNLNIGRRSIARQRPDENPDWLTTKPAGGNVRPPVNVRRDRLPFLDSGWDDFERLCRRLAETSGDVEAAWAYGSRGQKQYGIDILVRLKNGGYEVWQTKRYERAGPADLKAAVDIFLLHPWADKASRFVLAFACSLESTRVVEAIEDARNLLSSKNIAFAPLDAVRLTERLVAQPEIVDDFFGRSWVEKVCPPEALRRLAARFSVVEENASEGTYSSGTIGEGSHLVSSISAQGRKLDALAQGQDRLVTKDDLAALTKAIDESIVVGAQVRLPPKVADRELQREFDKALRRRGFTLADTAADLASLADRALDGDLALGSVLLRAEVLERAARANAVPETLPLAERFRNAAAVLEPHRDLFVVDAYVKEAGGGIDAALRDLKTRGDIDARSAVFLILMRQQGGDVALDWARAESLGPADFTAPSAMNLVLKTIEAGEFDQALAFISQMPAAYFGEISALRLIRSQLTLASLLPLDQKSAPFEGLPIDPRQFRFAGGPNTDSLVKAALADLEALLAQATELGIEYLSDFLSEFALWLRLEISDLRDEARAQLTQEITNTKTTLRRVRLALAYDIPFNSDALQRSLAARKQLGGWTSDERFAAFLIVFHSGDATTISNFIEAHADDLFAQSDLNRGYLAAIEVEALARAGRFDNARRQLERHSGKHLTDEQVRHAQETLTAIETGDEVEVHRQRYEKSNGLGDLRILVGELRARRDTKQLADYAPLLARATRTRQDFDAALKSLYEAYRDDALVDLANELPDLTGLDLDYEALRGWSLFRLGRIMEARAIARKLLTSRHNRDDRELAINTAIESGDWGYLQAVLANEVVRIDALTAHEAMRLSRLALESGSTYVDQFRDAALAKAPDDPQVHLSAYMLATERGEEYQGSQAQEWFERAIELSGPDGPVQTLSFREIIDRASGWRERTEKIDMSFRRAEIPAFLAARALSRRLLDLTYGQVRRNLDTSDRRPNYPVFAFSGAKPDTKLNFSMAVALDVTSLVTLQYLGFLDRALANFDRIVLAPRTLSFLFAERQFIRVNQPSQVAKARRVQTLIASGRLRVVPCVAGRRSAAGREFGEDLAVLLEAARASGGLVVRSAPVPKIGSYLDESADMSAWAPVLTDTLAVLAFLSTQGRIDAVAMQSAERYLRHVDRGWDMAIAVRSDSQLYLDDLSITYLDYVGLLEPLTRSVGAVYVHEDAEEHARQILRHSENSNELLELIERVRSTIATNVEGGRVVFSGRARPNESSDDGQEELDPGDATPTLDLLSDLTAVDAIVVDDRCLNKLPQWIDLSGRTVAAANTLDLLAALAAAGNIDDKAYWRSRHQLRAGGFFAMPIGVDELLDHLATTLVVDGAIRETPELRAVRESIVLPLINDAAIAPEAIWLNSVRFTLLKAIRAVWAVTPDADVAQARADWLLTVLPNPLEWCLTPDDVASLAASQQQVAVQTALLMVFTEGSRERQRRYFSWLDARIVTPLRTMQPEMWDATLDFLKSYLVRLWEIGDAEA
ncbi:HTH domain-containing protein [Mesorhizobium australicum]|uniref:HTH domain-containing protein n=1 Tax=Mesorhizobium australicum TaxID=536018 RepID=UPI003339E050